jgi:transposase
MPVITEVVHPSSLDFRNQRKVVLCRDVRGDSWAAIRLQVRNLKGARPSLFLVRSTYNEFSSKRGRRTLKYKKCGRKPWKVTKDVEAFLLKRLRALRRECICTSTTLQREVVREHGVALAGCTIRKVLQRNGYHWLPRAQKRKFTPSVMAERLAFAQRVVSMRPATLRKTLALAMDGVILSMPPKDAVDRANFCTHGESHMWRKRSEAALPELAGDDPYAKQVPLSRAVPLWAGISHGGFSPIIFHPTKKLQSEEWAACVNSGKVTSAIKKLMPEDATGPWRVLCDNESFLRAPCSQVAHKKQKINLWKIPARSPDFNPIEKFWAWLRKVLRHRDLADLKAKRPSLDKAAYIARVRAICRSQKAKRVASACCAGLQRVCKEVVKKKGGMARS